jgi:hypothetical protein
MNNNTNLGVDLAQVLSNESSRTHDSYSLMPRDLQKGFVSGDDESGLARKGTGDELVVVRAGAYMLLHGCGFDEVRTKGQELKKWGKVHSWKLRCQSVADALVLDENLGRQYEFHRPLTPRFQDTVRAPTEGNAGHEHVRVQNDPHLPVRRTSFTAARISERFIPAWRAWRRASAIRVSN